jgi:predicted acetyltransferase
MSSIVARSSARISAAVTTGRIARQPTPAAAALVYRWGMGLEFRTVADDEIPAFREAALSVFGADPEAEAGINAADQHRALIGPGQAWAAFDNGMIVATAATFDLPISLPGGTSMPMAGLTLVTVRPTHRRRGILRELMKLHFADARERGFAISGLWASDVPIYPRFGYGLAAYCDALEIPNAHTLTIAAREFDSLEPIDEARARALLPDIYARAIASRPGALRRSDVWWRERRFLEIPWARAGASRRRHVVVRRGEELVGYLVYRQRSKFTDGIPDGRVEINELLAVDAQAEATLWRFALSIDLFPTVAWWNAPADSALPWLVSDMRRIKSRRGDALWLRIDDIPATLAARRYANDGQLCFVLTDAEGNPPRYELVVEDGVGRCTPTTRGPGVAFSTRTLSTLFLGCASASQLARAGLVQGRPDTILDADRLFYSPVAPWCPEVF